MLAALDEARRRGAAGAAAALRRAARSPRSWPTALRAAPGARRGRGRRLGAALRRDLQGHRPDRDRDRPGGARAGARRAPARRRSRAAPGERARGSRPTTGSRSTCGSSPPTPTATCSSTSPARPQHNVELRERAVEMGLSVSEHGIADDRDRRGRALRDRGRGLRAPRPRLHRARAARGRGEIAAAAEGRLPELVEVERHPRRPPLPHHALRRPQHARGDGRGAPARAATPTSRSPTTRPATASATTSTPTRCCERIEEVARAERDARGKRFRVLAGSEVNILPDGSLDYDDELLARARLGDRQRPHLVPDLRARR